MNEILNNIYQIRTKLGLSQEYVANQLNIKQSGYAMIEKGQRELKYSTLSQIAIIFGMDVVDVIRYPQKSKSNSEKEEGVKAVLQIELTKDKKDQVLKIVFGDNNLEILNR